MVSGWRLSWCRASGYGGQLGEMPLLRHSAWDETGIALPRQWSGRRLRNVLTEGASIETADRLMVGDVLGDFPVALLEG